MPQSDRHLYAHAEADVAGSSVASTPTTSRTATPTPVTPEQAGTFGMASQAGGQQSPFIVTPRARPRSSTSAASGHSGTSKESDPLAVLFASFPVPPVTEEDMLLRLERSLRLENGRNLFNLRPSNSGPPPDRPIPPLPPIRPETDSSPEVEPAKQHTDALGLALTYASQLQRTGDSGEATSSLTVGLDETSTAASLHPETKIRDSSSTRELATGTLLAVNCSADGTDVESRTRPRSNDSQGPIIDTSGAGPQDTSDSSVYKDEDDNASLARGAQSHHSQRCADHQPASASARSSSDLEVIKADLTELLASFRPASTRAPSPRSRERSRTRSQAEAMTLSARPEPDSEETSPREINASRKSSVDNWRLQSIQARSQRAISCQLFAYDLAPVILVHTVDGGVEADRLGRRLG
ncbi:hypothetical protein RHOSPDRAFT_26634 [Rhodotorula sp. JG-1b]|nr:hypothetical protein RHOSPDRAFT_26634 [Rhodotorula sp. JG-1b]